MTISAPFSPATCKTYLSFLFESILSFVDRWNVFQKVTPQPCKTILSQKRFLHTTVKHESICHLKRKKAINKKSAMLRQSKIMSLHSPVQPTWLSCKTTSYIIGNQCCFESSSNVCVTKGKAVLKSYKRTHKQSYFWLIFLIFRKAW